MASSYPTSLDSFTDPTSGSSLASPSHSGQHIDLNDAVEKLETKLGIGSSNASSATAEAMLRHSGSGSTAWSMAYARGVVGYAKVSTSQLGITTRVDLTGLTTTFTAKANTYYMAMAQLNPYGTASSAATVFFYEGASILSTGRIYFPLNNVVDTRNYFTVWTTTAGSKTVKLQMELSSGAGSANQYADSDFDCFLIVMELGPS